MFKILAEGSWLERLKKRLRWEHTTYAVSEPTRAFYQAPSNAVDLMGIPLAPSGITVVVSTYFYFNEPVVMNDA